jgi:hypothetical protein
MVVTASWDNTARLWDAITGKPLGEPMRHEASVLSASFSADSRKVVTTNSDKTARLWDATTGKPLGEPMRHDAPPGSSRFSADGRWTITETDSRIRWWERLDETRYRLAGIRWTRGIKWIGEPWVSPDGRDVKAAELFTGDSVVVRTLRLGAGDPDLPALTGSPAELLAEWQRRLALKFEDETRSPKLVPMYGLPSGSAPLRRPLPDKTP